MDGWMDAIVAVREGGTKGLMYYLKDRTFGYISPGAGGLAGWLTGEAKAHS
jgi:hypothetical protein